MNITASVASILLVGCSMSGEPILDTSDKSYTNGDVYMADDGRIFVNYDHETVTISARSGERSYEKFVQLADGLKPGQKKRLNTATGMFERTESEYKIFGFLQGAGNTAEATTVTIARDDVYFSCYAKFLENFEIGKKYYLLERDLLQIEKCKAQKSP